MRIDIQMHIQTGLDFSAYFLLWPEGRWRIEGVIDVSLSKNYRQIHLLHAPAQKPMAIFVLYHLIAQDATDQLAASLPFCLPSVEKESTDMMFVRPAS